MIEKNAWRGWYLSPSLEDGKALMLCPLILLPLPGNVPIIWLDSVRPFGWMHSGREGKEGSSGPWRQSSGTKVESAQYAQRPRNWLVWLEYLEHGSPGKGEGEDMSGAWAKKAPTRIQICLEKDFSPECVTKVG